MSVWRRKAIELFPDLQAEIEEPDLTPMLLFFDLLPRARDANRDRDFRELTKLFDYAIWCAREKSNNLWNAAYVGFIEHLVDSERMRASVQEWLPPDIFENALTLFAARLDDARFADLVRNYNRSRKTTFSADRGNHL